MLKQSLAILSGVALLSGFGAIFNAPSYAGSGPFSCNESNNTTVVGAGKVVLRWNTEEFSAAGYDPSRRCQEVSSRFNDFYGRGQLNYITAGIVNGMPVVCAASPGGSCHDKNVLFTLSKNNSRNLAGVLQRLFNNRTGAAGPSVVYESSERAYIDVNKLLSDAGVGTSAPASTEPSSDTQPSAAPTGSPW